MNKHTERKTCFTRRTFSMHPAEYTIQPVCPNCGSNEHWWVDNHRQSKDEAKKQRNCNCPGYLWSCNDGFHRWGSKGCIHRNEKLMGMAAGNIGGEVSETCLF